MNFCVSELANLKVSDVNLEQAYVRCFGKGSKERLVPIGKYAVAAVKDYLEKRKMFVLNTESDSKHLFLDEKGHDVSRQKIYLLTRCVTVLLLIFLKMVRI